MLTNFTKTIDTEEFSFYLDEFVDYLHLFFRMLCQPILGIFSSSSGTFFQLSK